MPLTINKLQHLVMDLWQWVGPNSEIVIALTTADNESLLKEYKQTVRFGNKEPDLTEVLKISINGKTFTLHHAIVASNITLGTWLVGFNGKTWQPIQTIMI